MNKEPNEYKFHKLIHDFVELAENYEKEIEVWDFGYQIISIASQMIFHCAPQEGVAYRTILEALENGYKMHKYKKEENE